jgi:hypothetical protein
MIPVALKSISPYLSMHMKNVQIEGSTRPVHEFECMVVLDSELKTTWKVNKQD